MQFYTSFDLWSLPCNKYLLRKSLTYLTNSSLITWQIAAIRRTLWRIKFSLNIDILRSLLLPDRMWAIAGRKISFAIESDFSMRSDKVFLYFFLYSEKNQINKIISSVHAFWKKKKVQRQWKNIGFVMVHNNSQKTRVENYYLTLTINKQTNKWTNKQKLWHKNVLSVFLEVGQ